MLWIDSSWQMQACNPLSPVNQAGNKIYYRLGESLIEVKSIWFFDVFQWYSGGIIGSINKASTSSASPSWMRA